MNYCFLSCRQHRDGLDTARAPSGQKQGSCGSYPFNKLPLEPYALPLYSERGFSAHNSNLSNTLTCTRALSSTHIYAQTNAISLLYFIFLLLQVGQLITFFKIATSVRNYLFERGFKTNSYLFFSQIYIGCH